MWHNSYLMWLSKRNQQLGLCGCQLWEWPEAFELPILTGTIGTIWVLRSSHPVEHCKVSWVAPHLIFPSSLLGYFNEHGTNRRSLSSLHNPGQRMLPRGLTLSPLIPNGALNTSTYPSTDTDLLPLLIPCMLYIHLLPQRQHDTELFRSSVQHSPGYNPHLVSSLPLSCFLTMTSCNMRAVAEEMPAKPFKRDKWSKKGFQYHPYLYLSIYFPKTKAFSKRIGTPKKAFKKAFKTTLKTALSSLIFFSLKRPYRKG